MTTPFYPAALPFTPIDGTLSGQMEDDRISFKPDVGPAITRPRSTAAYKPLSFDVQMNRHQLALLEQFYRVTCGKGAVPFNAQNPYDPFAPAKFSWVNPPADRASLPNSSKFRVTFSLMMWMPSP